MTTQTSDADRTRPASKPIRVLQLVDSLLPAGAEVSLLTLAPHLLDRGVELHLGYLIERGGLRKGFEDLGIPVTSMDSGAASRRDWYVKARHLVKQTQPNVVHTTLFEADLAGRLAAAREGVPSISSLVTVAYDRNHSASNPWLKVEAARLADAVTGLTVARFHAVTQHVARVMGRRLMIPQSKIDVVHRGRDGDSLGRRTEMRRDSVRRRLGLSFDTPLILAVGRQEPAKGFDVLIGAVPSVLSVHPTARFFIAGRSGRASEALMEQVRSARLTHNVTFLGARSDVPDLMAAADVLAFPSVWEGAAGTLLEAMALECPVVSSNLPTLAETVDTGTALMVPPLNSFALGAALSDVLADPVSAARRATAGRRRFEDSFTIEASADGMAALYRRAARV